MREVARWFDDRPIWQRWVIRVVVAVAVYTTCALAAGVFQHGRLIVTVGKLVLLGGWAALHLAPRD